eukprot:scpid58221/ scgid1130/ RING finger protein 157
MGAIPTALRRGEQIGEDIELGADPAGARAAVNPYRYPPKNGELYFGNSFWIGGQKFDMDASDGFLFGDNIDVNFFSGRARSFPFSVPQVGQPTSVLQALVNIRKDSLKLTRDADEPTLYAVEFIYDADVESVVTIFLQAREIYRDGVLSYQSQVNAQSSGDVLVAGYGQTFKSTYFLAPEEASARMLTLPSDGPSGVFPLIVMCEVGESDLNDQQTHAHILIANLEKSGEDVYTAKAVKQKQVIDGTVLLLQEIYGLDGVARTQPGINMDDDDDDNDDDDADGFSSTSQTGMECELCLSEPRDTMILPCRHLSICSSCADQLRFSASNCPFCRQPFSALLHIRAFKEVRSPAHAANSTSACSSVPMSPQGNTSASGSNRPGDVSPSDTELAIDAAVAAASPPSAAAAEQVAEIPGYHEVTLSEAFAGMVPKESAPTRPARACTVNSDVAESLDDDFPNSDTSMIPAMISSHAEDAESTSAAAAAVLPQPASATGAGAALSDIPPVALLTEGVSSGDGTSSATTGSCSPVHRTVSAPVCASTPISLPGMVDDDDDDDGDDDKNESTVTPAPTLPRSPSYPIVMSSYTITGVSDPVEVELSESNSTTAGGYDSDDEESYQDADDGSRDDSRVKWVESISVEV